VPLSKARVPAGNGALHPAFHQGAETGAGHSRTGRQYSRTRPRRPENGFASPPACCPRSANRALAVRARCRLTVEHNGSAACVLNRRLVRRYHLFDVVCVATRCVRALAGGSPAASCAGSVWAASSASPGAQGSHPIGTHTLDPPFAHALTPMMPRSIAVRCEADVVLRGRHPLADASSTLQGAYLHRGRNGGERKIDDLASVSLHCAVDQAAGAGQ
jgi:hypothetical protein